MTRLRWISVAVALVALAAMVFVWSRSAPSGGGRAVPVAVGSRSPASARPSEERRPPPDAARSRSTVEPGVAPPSESVRVRGRVVDGGGQPLGGAEILGAKPWRKPGESWVVHAFESRSSARGAPRPTVVRARSSADGAFELSLERCDEVHLALRHAGFAGVDLARELPATESELDLGSIVLAPGARLPGRVVDAAGRPVSGAEVLRDGFTALSARLELDWSESVLATAAADGTFELDTLALGPTSLEVRAPGFVHTGREVFADALRLPEWRVTLARAAPITGRVTNAPSGAELVVAFCEDNEQRTVPCSADGSFEIDGLPPDAPELNLQALLLRDDSPDAEEEAISPWVPARTGMRGIEIPVPSPITYRLRVVDAGTQAPLTGFRIGRLESFDFESEQAPEVRMEADGACSIVVLFPAPNEGRAFAVAREGYERVAVGQLPFRPGTTQDLGTVALTRLSATLVRVVADADGRPIAGAEITASRETDEDCFCAFGHVVTRWPARKALPDGWEGTTSVDGTATAYLSPGESYSVSAEDAEHAPLRVRVVADPAPPERLELRLLRGATVTVSCLDSETSAPRARARIHCERKEGLSWRSGERADTGTDGRVAFRRLVPGRYAFWPEPLQREEGAKIVEVQEGASVELAVLRPADVVVRLHGMVSDHGLPLAGARVATWGSETATDLAGRYVFEREEPGEEDLVITHPRFGLVSTQRIVLAAPETRLDVELALVPVRGVVRDEEGRPLSGAIVALATAGEGGGLELLRATAFGEFLGRTQSADDGSFSFPAVQPRTDLYVVVEDPGFHVARLGPLEFPLDGDALVLETKLQRALELDVIVQDSDPLGAFSEVVASWRGAAALAPGDGAEKARRIDGSREAGSACFHFDHLCPGPWSIELRSFHAFHDPPLARVEVELAPSGNASVVLRP